MLNALKTALISGAFVASLAGAAWAQSSAVDFPQTNMDIGDSGMTMTEGAYSIFMTEDGSERDPEEAASMFNEASAEDREVAGVVCSEAEQDQAGYTDNVRDVCKLAQPQ